MKPDSIKIYVWRLRPGMITVHRGLVLAIEHRADWYDVTTQRNGAEPITLSSPGAALVEVFNDGS